MHRNNRFQMSDLLTTRRRERMLPTQWPLPVGEFLAPPLGVALDAGGGQPHVYGDLGGGARGSQKNGGAGAKP